MRKKNILKLCLNNKYYILIYKFDTFDNMEIYRLNNIIRIRIILNFNICFSFFFLFFKYLIYEIFIFKSKLDLFLLLQRNKRIIQVAHFKM